MRSYTGVRIVCLILCLGLLAGCGNLLRLSADTRETRERLRLLEGNVRSTACRECVTIIVVLGGEDDAAVHNFRVFERTEGFRIAALRESRFLFAFQDLNRDFSYQPGEPAAWFDLGGIRYEDGVATGIEIALGGPLQRPAPTGLTNLFEMRGANMGSIDVQLGRVVGLDDDRFSPEAAEMGTWEPIRAMKSGNAGVFFLEPFDRRRTPVLFIHGISGSPRDFATMIENIDRKRFQPWVLSYPSGLDLRALGDGLVGLVAELRHRHEFSALHIVAHSMGGLLAQEYLAECARTRGCEYMRRFISISTPFSGEATAGLGVSYAPVVVPVWRNLTPGSPFLRHLFDVPLPDGASHHLVFSFRNTSGIRRGSGDGVIPLESQLRLDAQVQAAAVRGFNDDHMSILVNPEVHRYVNAVLADIPAR